MSALELFLESIRLSPPGGRWSFFWHKDKNKRRSFVGGFCFDVYVDFEKRRRASLLLMKENQDLLAGFLIENSWEILGEFFYECIAKIKFESSYFSHHLSPACSDSNATVLTLTPKEMLPILENDLKKFLKEHLKPSVFCMPILGVECLAPHTEGDWLWVPGNFNLGSILNGRPFPSGFLLEGSFPPLSDWKGKRYALTEKDSWFIVRAHSESFAETYFRRMAGCLSIIFESPYAHRISGLELPGGRATFKADGSTNINFRAPTVPPIALPYKVRTQAKDIFWMLCSPDQENRVHICLEYLAESWGKSRLISFINRSIAMDALFGEDGSISQSILNGVEAKAGHISKVRDKYKVILKMRNAILHGEFSVLEASPSYLKYYEDYNSDPVDDQRHIIAECLCQIAEESQRIKTANMTISGG